MRLFSMRKSMASSKEYLEFILEQLSDLNGITYRKMMGEYIIYYQSKIVGGIYDDRFLIKAFNSALEYIPEIIFETPYEGAKEMILIKDIDNKDFITGLFKVIYNELSTK